MAHPKFTQTEFSLNCITGLSKLRGSEMINDQVVKCGVCKKTKKVASDRGAIKKIECFKISECCMGVINSTMF